MKKLFTFLIIVLCLLQAPVVYGAEDSQVWVDKLEARYKSMQDFQARFSQETYLAGMPQAQKGQGTLSFKKPDRMLWDYEAPERQQFILDGNNLWVYLPGEKQVMKNNYAVIPSHVVLDLFRGTVDLNKEFAISFVPQKEPPKMQEVVLELVPKVYNPSIRRLTLMLDQKLCTISRSTLEDDFGTVTVMHFSDFAIDAGLADKQFKFVPPAGVDVFELPKPPVSK